MIWNFLIPIIKTLQLNGYTVECASSKTGAYFDWLKEKHGLVMHCICFERNPFRLSNLKAYFDLKELIRKQGYDIVFCHEPVGGAMGRLVGVKCGCKIIYMAHGFHFYKGCSKGKFLFYLVERYLAKKTDYLITINQEDYEASLKFNAKHNLKTNGIGIDLARFQPFSEKHNLIYKELSLVKEDFVILSVGELIKRKNHESLIQAVAGLHNDKIHYIIAGDGEMREYLNELVRKLNITDNVHFLGYRQDISQLCNSCDVFALPSYQEGLSVALMEAMACGKSAIVSRIRGNVDLIDNGKGGILVETTDVEGYIQAIKRLMNNQFEREEYGKYNQVKVQDYSNEQVIPQLMSVFKDINGDETIE